MKKLFVITAVLATVFTACSKSNNNSPLPTTDSEKIVFEDANMKVTEYSAIPGGNACGQGMHSHLKHLTTILSDGKVEINLPDGTKIPVTVHAGDTFWEEAGTHQVINKGSGVLKSRVEEVK